MRAFSVIMTCVNVSVWASVYRVKLEKRCFGRRWPQECRDLSVPTLNKPKIKKESLSRIFNPSRGGERERSLTAQLLEFVFYEHVYLEVSALPILCYLHAVYIIYCQPWKIWLAEFDGIRWLRLIKTIKKCRVEWELCSTRDCPYEWPRSYSSNV